jgi:hypothetical protein
MVRGRRRRSSPPEKQVPVLGFGEIIVSDLVRRSSRAAAIAAQLASSGGS